MASAIEIRKTEADYAAELAAFAAAARRLHQVSTKQVASEEAIQSCRRTAIERGAPKSQSPPHRAAACV